MEKSNLNIHLIVESETFRSPLSFFLDRVIAFFIAYGYFLTNQLYIYIYY